MCGRSKGKRESGACSVCDLANVTNHVSIHWSARSKGEGLSFVGRGDDGDGEGDGDGDDLRYLPLARPTAPQQTALPMSASSWVPGWLKTAPTQSGTHGEEGGPAANNSRRADEREASAGPSVNKSGILAQRRERQQQQPHPSSPESASASFRESVTPTPVSRTSGMHGPDDGGGGGGGDNSDNNSDSDNGPTLGIPVTGAAIGFGAGFYQSAKRAGLVFLAENAHRRPDTVQGWYFYNKTKVRCGNEARARRSSTKGPEKGLAAVERNGAGTDSERKSSFLLLARRITACSWQQRREAFGPACAWACGRWRTLGWRPVCRD